VTLDERREELERIRNAPSGGTRIAAIYNSGKRDDAGILTRPSFVQAMIDHILAREFAAGTTDRRTLEVGDFVRTADGVMGRVVIVDEAYCDAYVRLFDDAPGVGLRLFKIASLEKTCGPPSTE
jgi:hypothetical protein